MFARCVYSWKHYNNVSHKFGPEITKYNKIILLWNEYLEIAQVFVQLASWHCFSRQLNLAVSKCKRSLF